MSLFLRTFAPLRATSRAIQRPAAASFSTSSIRSALSESDHAQDQPDRKAKIDHHQKDSIDRAKKGEGEWKPELASNSEQVAQADKDDLSMEEMQKMGAKKAEEGKQPSGSSSNQG